MKGGDLLALLFALLLLQRDIQQKVRVTIQDRWSMTTLMVSRRATPTTSNVASILQNHQRKRQ
jgi:hypothetical protein